MTAFAAQRTKNFGTTIFSEISELSRQRNAVNLGQGFPDFDSPEFVKEAVCKAVIDGKNQYALGSGEKSLRHAIAKHSLRFYGLELDPNREITVTTGATEAIFSACMAFIEPGDEVIVFQPYYDSYSAAIECAGGNVIAVTLHEPDFRFSPMELSRAFSEKTKAIIVNTPHNPTGVVFSRSELQFIAELCIEHNALAIVDEVYEHLVYQGVHTSMLSISGMRERTLSISSMGKTFSCTGWKVGWAIGNPELQKALRKIHQYTVFSTATPFQYAAAEALNSNDFFFSNLQQDFLQKRDFLVSMLAEIGMKPYVPDGGYFVMANYERLSDEPSDIFAKILIENAGVAAIPPAQFYKNPSLAKFLLRFCFCKKQSTLEEAASRLRRYFAATNIG